MCHHNNSLISILQSTYQKSPIIGEHVVTIFVTQSVTIATYESPLIFTENDFGDPYFLPLNFDKDRKK